MTKKNDGLSMTEILENLNKTISGSDRQLHNKKTSGKTKTLRLGIVLLGLVFVVLFLNFN